MDVFEQDLKQQKHLSQVSSSSASTTATDDTTFSYLVQDGYLAGKTERAFLHKLIKTCDRRKEEINELPYLRKTKNGPGMVLWYLTQEIHELVQELWKLLRETKSLVLSEKDWAILEVVLKVIELRVENVADKAKLQEAVITLRDSTSIFGIKKRKNMRAVLTVAADGLKEARNFSTSYRIGVSCDHRRLCKLMDLGCVILEPPKLPKGQAEIKQIRTRRPILPKRLSTGFSNASSSKLKSVHPPKVEL